MLIKFVTNVEWIICDSHIFDYPTLRRHMIKSNQFSLILDLVLNQLFDPNQNERMKYIWFKAMKCVSNRVCMLRRNLCHDIIGNSLIKNVTSGHCYIK